MRQNDVEGPKVAEMDEKLEPRHSNCEEKHLKQGPALGLKLASLLGKPMGQLWKNRLYRLAGCPPFITVPSFLDSFG